MVGKIRDDRIKELWKNEINAPTVGQLLAEIRAQPGKDPKADLEKPLLLAL